ncbi:trypsin-like peptidase domain-containing protein [Streptomyces sp. PA5.6]|uniref:VMAP-C domain-containing protein n=1 Tax=Streptomyces sp. PA5.6 TaxID=3035651 RepID=UPI003904CA8D
MKNTSWHARIDCGGEVGAGFLVSARHVLTCAHVVRDSAYHPVTVTFPHHRELTSVRATVTGHGGWQGRHDDPGDLAVLELERSVPVVPAEFAAPDDAYGEPRPRLIVYGFPHGYDEGTIAEYRVTAAQLIASEWVQLEAWSAHGQRLAPGFSGAAVALADTGRVVGMLSAADGTPDILSGRMLPNSVMSRYWPRLAELVRPPSHAPSTAERLRELVGKAADTEFARNPERLYLDAAGPFGPPVPEGGFDSLWAAAWYLLWEVGEPEAATRFADRLAALLDARLRPASATTCAAPGHTPCPAAPGATAPDPSVAGPAWTPILIEIEHSGGDTDQVLVTVSAHHEGRHHPVDSRTLHRSEVRAHVQEHIEEAFWHLPPGADELIAFVLPREWLNEPVAHWQRSADDPTPLGCSYPLVVTDRSRRTGGLRHQLVRKWDRLGGRPSAVLHRVECGTSEKPGRLRFLLRRDEADLAGFAAAPTAPRVRPHFEASLNAPAPILVWPRTGCEHGDHDEAEACAGTDFLDRLAAYLDGLPPAELPRHVLALRESAEASDAPERHWARDVQLLWDDPRCFPGAAAAPRISPVSPASPVPHVSPVIR